MEIKINKEIRSYTENVWMGLSLRQMIFAALACAVAILLYFMLRSKVAIGTLSWLCILGAAPFAAMGFITYNCMTAEQLALTWLRTMVLSPRQLKWQSENIYKEMLNEKPGKRTKKRQRKI